MSLRGEPRVLLPALPPGSAAAPCPDDTRKGSVDGEGDAQPPEGTRWLEIGLG